MIQKNLSCDPKEAAGLLFVTPETLCNWRYLGKGPKYFKAGGKVRYLYSEINRFLKDSIVDPGNRRCG